MIKRKELKYLEKDIREQLVDELLKTLNNSQATDKNYFLFQEEIKNLKSNKYDFNLCPTHYSNLIFSSVLCKEYIKINKYRCRRCWKKAFKDKAIVLRETRKWENQIREK